MLIAGLSLSSLLTLISLIFFGIELLIFKAFQSLDLEELKIEDETIDLFLQTISNLGEDYLGIYAVIYILVLSLGYYLHFILYLILSLQAFSIVTEGYMLYQIHFNKNADLK